MKRGGARIMAGRRLNPQPLDRIRIGTRCEQLATELAERTAWEKRRKVMQPTEIEEIQATVRRVRDGDATDDDRWEAEQASENIGKLMAELKRENPELKTPFVRAISIRIRRPKGRKGEKLRQQIKAWVATEFNVSPAIVEKCWKEYRRFLNGDTTPWKRKPRSRSSRV